MCGIAGFLGPWSENLIKTMVKSLRHRGPDGDGYIFDQPGGLAFLGKNDPSRGFFLGDRVVNHLGPPHFSRNLRILIRLTLMPTVWLRRVVITFDSGSFRSAQIFFNSFLR